MPRELRVERIARQLAEHSFAIRQEHRSQAEGIVARDEMETGLPFGQNVVGTYPLADFFIDASTEDRLRESIERFVAILFGDRFATPTREELAMFIADASALRSAELGRQVGAAIVNELGDVLATGTNEVPASGGGHYWTGDEHDQREFRHERDTSDERRSKIIDEIRAAVLEVAKAPIDAESLAVALQQSPIGTITEFGRAVHAEMSALMDAARRGVAIAKSRLFVTTFPCHNCTRHIVASGIQSVSYIYPYPKSLAADFHGDAIQADGLATIDSNRVPFLPFVGVSPRQYRQAFTMRERKDAGGHVLDRFEGPRVVEDPEWDINEHIYFEEEALKRSDDWLSALVEQVEAGAEEKQHGAKIGAVSAAGPGGSARDPGLAEMDEGQSGPDARQA
jgi:deoxycytidylate deaminase